MAYNNPNSKPNYSRRRKYDLNPTSDKLEQFRKKKQGFPPKRKYGGPPFRKHIGE